MTTFKQIPNRITKWMKFLLLIPLILVFTPLVSFAEPTFGTSPGQNGGTKLTLTNTKDTGESTSITANAHGAVVVVITDSDGNKKAFKFKKDENGNYVLVGDNNTES